MNKYKEVDELVLKNLYNESVDLAIALQDFIFKVRKTLKGSDNEIDDVAVTVKPILCEILFHDFMFTVGFMNDMANYTDDEQERAQLKNYPFNATLDSDKCPKHCKELRDIIARFYQEMKGKFKNGI